MSAADLAALTAQGAGLSALDASTGKLIALSPPKSTIGYARQVNSDKSVILTAFCFDGTAVVVNQPAP